MQLRLLDGDVAAMVQQDQQPSGIKKQMGAAKQLKQSLALQQLLQSFPGEIHGQLQSLGGEK